MNLDRLNQLPENEAIKLFLQCCSAESWASKMTASRPFSDHKQLQYQADNCWGQLQESDYLQAFEGHPKIGDVNSLRAKYANTKELASNEQSAVNQATNNTLEQLAEGNDVYLKKFGFIFIVCATGKSAQEMLDLLQQRLPNDRQTELKNATEQQRQIFQIRLDKALEQTS